MSAADAGSSPERPNPPAWTAAAATAVFAALLLVYFPPFLSRHGPYGEDKYFLSVLLRALDGQHPYATFEFIYGPLLIAPATAWMKLFGYSLHSYYWLLALVEASTFAAVAVTLGRMLPDRRRWLAALAASLILLFNDNLGLSYIALRRLLPVAILLGYAMRANRRRGWIAVALLLGFLLATSLEYAIACMAAIGGAATLEALAARRAAPLAAGIRVIAGGLVAGALIGLMLLGPDAMEWLRATGRIIRLRGAGEAGFPFQWSVNAVAVFALLLLGVARAASGMRGLGKLSQVPLLAGDRLLLASLGYAVVAMKSGLGRSDMYHLVPPVLGLVAAVLLPLPSAVFPALPLLRRLSVAAIVLTCATYAPGMIGAGRIWAQGWVLGAGDVLRSRPPNRIAPLGQRAPLIGPERTEANAVWLAMAEYVGAPERREIPVVFYESSWGLDRHIGVPKPRGVYPTDDYLVSDDAGIEIREYLEAHPEAMVIADTASWAFLRDSSRTQTFVNMFWIGRVRSLPVRLLERWSSSHFGTAVIEESVRKRDRWTRTVGGHLRAHYVPVAAFGRYLVLARTGTT